MPSVSKAQQRLMGAAEHGADFPMARKIRGSMTHQQMHDFASGSEAGKPTHVPHKTHPTRNLGKHAYPKKARAKDTEAHVYGQK